MQAVFQLPIRSFAYARLPCAESNVRPIASAFVILLWCMRACVFAILLLIIILMKYFAFSMWYDDVSRAPSSLHPAIHQTHRNLFISQITFIALHSIHLISIFHHTFNTFIPIYRAVEILQMFSLLSDICTTLKHMPVFVKFVGLHADTLRF